MFYVFLFLQFITRFELLKSGHCLARISRKMPCETLSEQQDNKTHVYKHSHELNYLCMICFGEAN